jgi:YVTN family beta-propeller protein
LASGGGFGLRLKMASLAAAAPLLGAWIGLASSALSGAQDSRPPAGLTEQVGKLGENRYLTPTGQVLTPTGRQVELPEMRPQALALSPDGKLLVATGKTHEIAIIDPVSGQLLQKVAIPNPSSVHSPDARSEQNNTQLAKEPAGQVSCTGLAFSPDGTRLFLSTVAGSVSVFSVDADHRVSASAAWPLPKTARRKADVPSGLAVSVDGKKLYVAGNLDNQLHELDARTGVVLRSWNTGAAPFAVVLAGDKAYVSNQGGRHPGESDPSAPSGKGTPVRVDGVRHIASDGSVTVIDLKSGTVKCEVPVELHPSAMALSPRGKYLVVANTGSDTLSVIETKTDQVVEKIFTRQSAADLFGAQPNALAFEPSGKRLWVANGTQNAVAMIDFDPADQESKVVGLLPVGWFPGALEFDPARNALYVANIKGNGAFKAVKPGEKPKFGTKDFHGTVSLVSQPGKQEIPLLTRLALVNLRYPKLAEASLPARPGQPPRPVPERVGEPSVFKHVLYVIKENRSYDQVLGDLKTGDGDPDLCIFGEKVTPNQHKIAREFVLLDNTYCSGVQSADGHQWTDSAIANSYIERQVTSGFPRSYPGGKSAEGVDALAWASSGFLWDHALAHGKTFRNYGEWMISEAGWADGSKKEKPQWLDYWNQFNAGTALLQLRSRPGIESLRKHSKPDTVGWDLNVPDVMRAAAFIEELKGFEAKGNLPHLMLLFLPNDHTGGTRGKHPAPASQVADNDLAFGQVVEAVSRSKFWAETCIIAIEDDPQAGWDHVSGYRTTCYVVSPYTHRRKVVHTQYNHTSVLRTIELMLGLPPMNQLDATATPMSDCFSETPDFTPFRSVPNTTPLDQLNPEPKKIADRQLRADAIASAKLPLEEADRCPEHVLNQILWRAMKGSKVAYPRWAVHSEQDND